MRQYKLSATVDVHKNWANVEDVIEAIRLFNLHNAGVIEIYDVKTKLKFESE